MIAAFSLPLAFDQQLFPQSVKVVSCFAWVQEFRCGPRPFHHAAQRGPLPRFASRGRIIAYAPWTTMLAVRATALPPLKNVMVNWLSVRPVI